MEGVPTFRAFPPWALRNGLASRWPKMDVSFWRAFMSCCLLQVLQVHASKKCPHPCIELDGPCCLKDKLFSKDSTVVLFYNGRDEFTKEALRYAWMDTIVNVSSSSDEFIVATGPNNTEVLNALSSSLLDYFWPIPKVWSSATSKSIGTFRDTYIGVKYEGLKDVKGRVCIIEKFHWRFPVFLVIGILLFLWAPNLCRNISLQYSTGTLVGILASLLILVYILSHLVPGKKIGAYAFLAVGWSSLAWLASVFSDHFLDFVVQNWQFALGYIAVSGLLSFAYVYWQGPISNPRSLTIVQWALQTVALLLICWSFQSNVLCLLAIILLLMLYNFPQRVKDYFRFRWYLWFPPKRRLLTMEEYNRQGEEETAKALTALREHCQSPGSTPWRLMARLRNPKRFARFLEGSYHIPAKEIHAYNKECMSDSSLFGEASFISSPSSSRSSHLSFGESEVEHSIESSSEDDS